MSGELNLLFVVYKLLSVSWRHLARTLLQKRNVGICIPRSVKNVHTIRVFIYLIVLRYDGIFRNVCGCHFLCIFRCYWELHQFDKHCRSRIMLEHIVCHTFPPAMHDSFSGSDSCRARLKLDYFIPILAVILELNGDVYNVSQFFCSLCFHYFA